MAFNMQNMLQTIVSLRQLQLSEAAQKLQEQQLGISQQNAQGASTAGLQNLLQGLSNPQSMAPYASQFATTTGLPEEAVRNIIGQTPAATATTKSAAVQSGARQLGGSEDTAAASQELTGMDPGSAMRSRLLADIFGGTGGYYANLPEEAKQGFQRGVLQNITTGQDVGTAAISSATADFMNRAAPGVRDEVVKIGKGLAPSASEAMQHQLGFAQFQSNQRIAEANLANEDIRTHAALLEAQNSLSKGAFQDANNLLKERSDLLQNFTKGSATMTDVGVQSYVDQVNAYNEQLRQIAPQIYGPKGTHPLQDLPAGSSTGARGRLEFFKAITTGTP